MGVPKSKTEDRAIRALENIIGNENLKNIFDIIASFYNDDRKEFILELLKFRKDIEMFRMLPLFENSIFWTGSEVPLIDEKLIF